MKRLKKSVESLLDTPRLGKAIPDLSGWERRMLIVGSYRIAYQLRDDAIDIMKVDHGARMATSLSPPPLLSKQNILLALQSLADEVTLEEVVERLLLAAKAERSRDQVDASDVVSHDEVKRRVGL